MSQRPLGRIAPTLAALLAAGLALASGPVQAGEAASEIRRLYQQGEIRSLETILARARRRFPQARLLEAELLRHEGRLVYEVELIDRDGVVHELFFDARSGKPADPVPEEHERH
jgi:uncharacterized membrane protein YkoI